MTNETTINKLIEMRLSVLADAYRTQLSDHSMQELSFEDRFGLLVDIEYNARKDNKRKRWSYVKKKYKLNVTNFLCS